MGMMENTREINNSGLGFMDECIMFLLVAQASIVIVFSATAYLRTLNLGP